MSERMIARRAPGDRALSVFAILAVSLLMSGGDVLGQGLGDADYIKGFKPRLGRIQSKVQSAKNLKVDQATFSPKVVVSSMGRRPDTQTLFFYVRDKIGFEPYEGAQRGVTGTLMARSGNSLDQSLLLKALLAEIKVKSRIAEGVLGKEDSARLLKAFVGEAELVGDKPAGMATYSVARDRSMLSAVRKHYWVEAYIAGRWVSMDPAFPRAVHGVPTTKKESDSEGVPASGKSSLTIKVYAIEDNGGGGELISVTRPMPEIVHRNVTLGFEFFDRKGALRNPWVKISGKQEKGRKFRWEGMQRLWVEFAFERGGKTRTKIVRDLYVAGTTTNLTATDQQVFSMIVLPSWVHNHFLTAVVQQEIAALHDASRKISTVLEREAQKAVKESAVDPAFARYTEEVMSKAGGVISLTYANVTDQIALNMAAKHGVRAYYADPRVLIVAGVRHRDRFYWQIDLRQNDIRAVPADGLPQLMAQGFQAGRGRFDSQFEAAATARLTGKSVLSVGAIFKAALKSKTTMVTLTPTNLEKTLDKLKISEEARDRLSFSVRKRGRLALVPEVQVSIGDIKTTGWWEMDKSGAIVGVRENGTHGADNFSASSLTGASKAEAKRTGSLRVLVFDEAISLIDHLSNTVVALLKGTPNVCPVVCSSAADLRAIPGLLCQKSGGMSALKVKEEVKACLTPVKSSDDILGLTQSCQERVKPARCGAAMSLAVLGGSYKIKYKTEPVGNRSSSWVLANLPPVSFAACGCK